MKLRIRGNSLRLRLTRSEVDQFALTGRFADQISFGGEQSLVYAIEKTDTATVSAVFDDGEITVFVPAQIADNWVNTDEVGFEAAKLIGDRNELKLLIEKDFACLTSRSGEETDDNFPHPKTTC